MSMLRISVLSCSLALLLAVSVGCKGDKKADKEKAAEVTCEDAWKHFAGLYRTQRTERASKAPEDVRKRVVDGIDGALEKMQDKWVAKCKEKSNAESRACMVKTKDMKEARACMKD